MPGGSSPIQHHCRTCLGDSPDSHKGLAPRSLVDVEILSVVQAHIVKEPALAFDCLRRVGLWGCVAAAARMMAAGIPWPLWLGGLGRVPPCSFGVYVPSDLNHAPVWPPVEGALVVAPRFLLLAHRFRHHHPHHLPSSDLSLLYLGGKLTLRCDTSSILGFQTLPALTQGLALVSAVRLHRTRLNTLQIHSACTRFAAW